jgi:hypothetical protein
MPQYLTHVQDYLLKHSLSDLYRTHGVRHSINAHKIGLNYHQIKARPSDPLACQCRGLILQHYHSEVNWDDVIGETSIMAWPFNRFFNSHDDQVAPIDWTTAVAHEKLDGTLGVFYYDWTLQKWCVGTRNAPNGNFSTNAFNALTARGLFEKGLLRETGLEIEEFGERLDPKHLRTWMFEITSPVNKLVVQYDDFGVTALGCRFLETGEEQDPRPYVEPLGCPVAATYDLRTFDQVVQFVQSRSPDEHEGVVVVDATFNRMKVKSTKHTLANHIQMSLSSSPKKIAALVLAETWDDISGPLPDYLRKQGDLMQAAFGAIVSRNVKIFEEVSREVENLDPSEQRKAFAITCKKSQGAYMAALLQNYRQPVDSLIEWFHARGAQFEDELKHRQQVRNLTREIEREMRRNGTAEEALWKAQAQDEE